jgi:hemerythrin superfamily protein
VDAITLLVEDHHRIDRLFDAISDGDVTAVPEVCEALLLHSRMEEEVLYPMVAATIGDAEGWDASAALDDHPLIRRLIAELEAEASVSPTYRPRAGTLMRLVRDHAREAEEILFPQVVTGLDPRLLEEAGDELQRVRDSGLSGKWQHPGSIGPWMPLLDDVPLDTSIGANAKVAR